MSVNTMTTEQAYTLINALHEQVTGQAPSVEVVDTASFVSVAQATLRCGYDEVIKAISQVLSKTIISVRPYNRKFKGLEYTADRWGGIVRKINFIEGETEEDNSYNLTDGNSIDQYVIKKPKVLETHYYGADVYKDHYTVLTRQLDVAFSNPTEFASFMAGVATHFSNMWEQWLENWSRTTLLNFMAGKLYNGDVVYLLDEYNALTGLNLTIESVRLPLNYEPFMKWAYARIAEISRTMEERSVLYQTGIDNAVIVRHTPKEDQRVYMLASFLESMKAEVQSGAFNDSFLNYSYNEAVSYWQNIREPNAFNVSPVVLNSDGTFEEWPVADIPFTNVIGVIFDRDAVGYNIGQDEIVASPYDAAGQYYNLYHHARVQSQNDFTEKGVVLALTSPGDAPIIPET